MSFLPNLITFGNLLCGFLGLLLIIYGDLTTGAFMVFIAAFFDLIDGLFARLLGVSSTIGKQLDSLADVVSFGILPAVIMNILLIKSHSNWVHSLLLGDIPIISLFAFFIAAAAAFRLAKFNIDDTQKKFFKGLPSPAGGLLIASLPLAMQYDLLLLNTKTIYLTPLILNPWFLISMTTLTSLLMISNIPIMSVKFTNFTWRDNYPRFILVIVSLILFAIFYFAAIPLIILFYIIISLVFKNKLNEV